MNGLLSLLHLGLAAIYGQVPSGFRCFRAIGPRPQRRGIIVEVFPSVFDSELNLPNDAEPMNDNGSKEFPSQHGRTLPGKADTTTKVNTRKPSPFTGRLAIFEKEHPEVAVSLNDLAALLRPCPPYETSGSSWCL